MARAERLEARTFLSATAPYSIITVPYEGGVQLRVTGTSSNDVINVAQNAAGALVVTNGAAYLQSFAGPFKSLAVDGGAGDDTIKIDASVKIETFLYGGAGNDKLYGGGGNNHLYGGLGTNYLQAGGGNDVLVAVGGTKDTLVGGVGRDSFWVQTSSNDVLTNVRPDELATGNVHRIGTFSGVQQAAASSTTKKVNKAAVKKASAKAAAPVSTDLLGQTLLEPSIGSPATGYQNFSSHPLFSDAGPSADDVGQGGVGDCYFLSVLASVARTDPWRIRQSVVDLGDGTYAVQFQKNGTSVYVRVDGNLPVASWGGLAYTDFGAQGSLWVALIEKAWTFARSGSGSYKSIDGGWMDESYTALGSSSQSTYSAPSGAQLLTLIKGQLDAGKSVTYAAGKPAAGAPLIGSHAYTVISVGLSATGAPASLVLRNPWGIDGAGNDGKDDGYVTLTAAQALTSMLGFVSAYV